MPRGTDKVSEVTAGLRALLETCSNGVGEGLLTAYLDHEQPTFTGAYFATFGSNPADAFTADDLAALSLLDVPAPRDLVLAVGLTATAKFNDLLSAVPNDVRLWDAEQPAIEAVDHLWRELKNLHQVGAVRADKLLARKRPQLHPITDRVVDRWFFQKGFRDALRGALRGDKTLRTRLGQTLTAELAGDLPLLRRIDIAVWLLGANNIHARQVRARLGAQPPPDRVRW